MVLSRYLVFGYLDPYRVLTGCTAPDGSNVAASFTVFSGSILESMASKT